MPADLTGSISAHEEKKPVAAPTRADDPSPQVSGKETEGATHTDARPPETAQTEVMDKPSAEQDTAHSHGVPGSGIPQPGAASFSRAELSEESPSGRMPTTALVRAIQRELAQRGYRPGRQDGFVDLPTRMAILAYQYDAGLQLTGAPSEGLLKHILFGPFVVRPDAPASEWRFERDPDLVGEVQRTLAALGYSAAQVNGRLGRETREAIMRFEEDREMPRTGRVSSRVLLELVIVTGQSFGERG